jgi:hypothetical protein
VRVTRPEQLECPPGDHLQQSYLVTNLVTNGQRPDVVPAPAPPLTLSPPHRT